MAAFRESELQCGFSGTWVLRAIPGRGGFLTADSKHTVNANSVGVYTMLAVNSQARFVYANWHKAPICS